jgi:hypothetical protein
MYVKITNENECHYGFQYNSGLNVLDKRFEKSGSCVEGGFYITNLENVHNFYYKGIWLRTIGIPQGAKSVKDPDTLNGEKWKLDRIILKDKYPLYDLETIKKFNLKITDYYITEVCKKGKIDILEWYINDNSLFRFTDKIIIETCEYGQIKTLEWFYKNNYLNNVLLSRISILDKASAKGHVNVLEWYLNNKLHLNYTESALDDAVYYNHINVLDWWFKSNLPLKYSTMSIEYASWMSNINVLEWWIKSNLPLKYSDIVLDLASENEHINVLEWWINSKLPIKYDTFINNYNKYYCKTKSIREWYQNVFSKN